MGKVNLLSGEIVNRIAAGEVVERPAAVVKELIENSLDAGAVNIFVELKKAGKKLISVKDDGGGIEPDDMTRLFTRHATSKISRVEDLYVINSLGFRGEALYSIGTVADVVVRSKSSGDPAFVGKEMHVRGGKNIGIIDVSHPGGTTVEVRELFFNTPARKKFLRTDATEFRRILNILVPYTLMFPDRRFSLRHNGRIILACNPAADILERFCDVLNVERKHIIKDLMNVSEKSMSLQVLLGDVNVKRPARDQQYIFINGRPVYSQSLSYAVNVFYRSIFPSGIHPVFAVFLRLPAGAIDVNIHPSKREVKIKDEHFISAALSEFCHKVFSSSGHVKTAVKKEAVYFSGGGKGMPVRGGSPGYGNAGEQGDNIFDSTVCDLPSTDRGGETVSMREKLKNAVYIGCYRNKYLFFESGDGLLAMDQHAAHERINYECLQRQFESGNVEVQRLLTPIVINLNPVEIESWEDGAESLETAGFLTTRWDKNSIAVHGFPRIIRDAEVSIRSILAEKNIERCDKKTLAQRACKGAVLAGENIRPEEAVHIKDALLECAVPFVCPHGRPTVVEFTESFFDRQFLR